MLENVHPGEILLEEFLKEFGISQNRLGREIGMSPRAINEIVHGKRSITANSALRATPLAMSRLATFPQAMRRRRTTAPVKSMRV